MSCLVLELSRPGAMGSTGNRQLHTKSHRELAVICRSLFPKHLVGFSCDFFPLLSPSVHPYPPDDGRGRVYSVLVQC